MNGLSTMTNSRRVVTIEKLKHQMNSNSGDDTLEMVLDEMDLLIQRFNGTTTAFDSSFMTLIYSLCENLKMFGPQLENTFKDQLDRCYIALRNGCRDDRVPLPSRYRLLEVIELRAMNWHPNENVVAYYRQKLAQAETEEPKCEIIPTNVGSYPPPYYSNSPSHCTQAPPQPSPPAVTPPLLNPGEVVKNSGKYNGPSRLSGKGQMKDEIVIRNADSGKVMGLKGRRVHMIEEMSETIISFQRVAPGARERLVQITGMSEENINQAIQLIEETIRRNASPVRSDDRNDLLNVSAEPFTPRSSFDDSNQASHRRSTGEEPFFESTIEDYRYTVTQGDDFIRISGSNLELVRTAKLVLEEFFSKDRKMDISNNSSFDMDSPSSSLPDSTYSGDIKTTNGHKSPKYEEHANVDHKVSKNNLENARIVEETTKSAPEAAKNGQETRKSSQEGPKKGVVTVVRQPIIPASKFAIESVESVSSATQEDFKTRRMLFAKTKEEKEQQDINKNLLRSTRKSESVSPVPVSRCSPPPPSRKTYTREFLVRCASSPICTQRLPPSESQRITLLQIMRKDSNPIDPNKLLNSQIKWEGDFNAKRRSVSIEDGAQNSQ